jgi:hypothetical protein
MIPTRGCAPRAVHLVLNVLAPLLYALGALADHVANQFPPHWEVTADGTFGARSTPPAR